MPVERAVPRACLPAGRHRAGQADRLLPARRPAQLPPRLPRRPLGLRPPQLPARSRPHRAAAALGVPRGADGELVLLAARPPRAVDPARAHAGRVQRPGRHQPAGASVDAAHARRASSRDPRDRQRRQLGSPGRQGSPLAGPRPLPRPERDHARRPGALPRHLAGAGRGHRLAAVRRLPSAAVVRRVRRAPGSLGLDPAKPVVLYAGNTPTNQPYEANYVDRIVEWWEQTGEPKRFQLLFRPHPRDNKVRSASRPRSTAPGAAVQDSSYTDLDDLATLLQHVACVVANGGTILLDGVVNDRPSVCITFDAGAPPGERWADLNLGGVHYRELIDSDALYRADDFDGLFAAIERALARARRVRRRAQARLARGDGRGRRPGRRADRRRDRRRARRPRRPMTPARRSSSTADSRSILFTGWRSRRSSRAARCARSCSPRLRPSCRACTPPTGRRGRAEPIEVRRMPAGSRRERVTWLARQFRDVRPDAVWVQEEPIDPFLLEILTLYRLPSRPRIVASVCENIFPAPGGGSNASRGGCSGLGSTG